MSPIRLRTRTWRPGAWFHVIMRGNNRMNVYNTDMDKYHLMRCLADARIRYDFTMIAYCIMSNHFHFLLKSEDDLSKIMRLINRRYTDYYSKKYKHVGRIYQSRYFAKTVESPSALLMVSRYIHRNPIETKVPMVTELAAYPHSSFPFYMKDTTPPDYLNTEFLPGCLPAAYDASQEGYVTYCLQTIEEQEDMILAAWLKDME
ncbi:transposase [Sporosarcina trichiuri]|uniref:transposase n=1 Tax=Sporosarcina trichiuri TaxID=3056445 RepID=UPI0025B2C892|nr:transposase [Sporosarcina sp. 0.2-SM1T-5]WJY26391.1 transposase [Sporosarcina sp. 0.2-SM1T-5]